MPTKILSVSGKPGSYKLISTRQNFNIVDSLLDAKRIPFYLTEKVVALSDVSIYTTEEDMPLREVFQKIKEKENGEKTVLGSKSSNGEVFRYFEEILPNYDTEKVYASDIKKILNWYNILINSGIDFDQEEPNTEEPAGTEPENNEK